MPRTKESGILSGTAEWHSVAYLRQAYLDMEAERDALREALEEALPWIGVREDNRGHWCPPEVRETARVALERHP